MLLIGESIRVQEAALSLLLTLLLAMGGITLVGAGLGGLFLADRALTPARLAWTHQQRFIADARCTCGQIQDRKKDGREHRIAGDDTAIVSSRY